MKTTLILLILFLFTPLTQGQTDKPKDHLPLEAKIEEAYNEAEDKTVVWLNPFQIKKDFVEEFGLYAGFRYPGQKFVSPEQVMIGIAYVSRQGFKYTNSHDLTILADGEQIKLGTARHSQKTSDTFPAQTYFEYIGITVPLQIFSKIANAKSVKAVLGSTEIGLSETHLKALRELANHTSPANK